MPDAGELIDPPWSPLAADNAIHHLLAWRRDGISAALVTLLNIEGTTPRPIGAQMAIAEDGRFAGYLSGGCLEAAVAKEAQSAMREGRNRLVRYGRGSHYMDIKLPCGSGLDLYIDQNLDAATLDAMSSLASKRHAFFLETDLETATSRIVEANGATHLRSVLERPSFRRAYCPAPRVLLIGGGPHLCSLAHLIAAAGLEIDIATPDDDARRDIIRLGLRARDFSSEADARCDRLDRWSAAVLAFHEHAWEVPVIARLLHTECFYIGALGSKTAHTARQRGLMDRGFSAEEIARVRGPIGSIPGAKSRITLAVGVLAEIVAEAKARDLLQ